MRKVSEEEVRAILRLDKTQKQIAKELKMSIASVQRIRAGIRHSNIAPEVPRREPYQVARQGRILNEEQVTDILQQHSQSTLISLAHKHGVSKETIRSVVDGLRYTDMAPELPRRPQYIETHKCSNCIHYGGTQVVRNNRIKHKCTLGIPEIKGRLGVKTAQICSCFTQ